MLHALRDTHHSQTVTRNSSKKNPERNRNLIVDGQNPNGVESKIDKQRRIENGGIENQNGFEKLT